VPVGRRPRHLGGADVPGGAGLVLDKDRFAERGGQPLRKDASQQVERPAGGKRIDEPDRLRRIRLRRRGKSREREKQ
jgi:hypothetical protein